MYIEDHYNDLYGINVNIRCITCNLNFSNSITRLKDTSINLKMLLKKLFCSTLDQTTKKNASSSFIQMVELATRLQKQHCSTMEDEPYRKHRNFDQTSKNRLSDILNCLIELLGSAAPFLTENVDTEDDNNAQEVLKEEYYFALTSSFEEIMQRIENYNLGSEYISIHLINKIMYVIRSIKDYQVMKDLQIPVRIAKKIESILQYSLTPEFAQSFLSSPNPEVVCNNIVTLVRTLVDSLIAEDRTLNTEACNELSTHVSTFTYIDLILTYENDSKKTENEHVRKAQQLIIREYLAFHLGVQTLMIEEREGVEVIMFYSVERLREVWRLIAKYSRWNKCIDNELSDTCAILNTIRGEEDSDIKYNEVFEDEILSFVLEDHIFNFDIKFKLGELEDFYNNIATQTVVIDDKPGKKESALKLAMCVQNAFEIIFNRGEALQNLYETNDPRFEHSYLRLENRISEFNLRLQPFLSELKSTSIKSSAFSDVIMEYLPKLIKSPIFYLFGIDKHYNHIFDLMLTSYFINTFKALVLHNISQTPDAIILVAERFQSGLEKTNLYKRKFDKIPKLTSWTHEFFVENFLDDPREIYDINSKLFSIIFQNCITSMRLSPGSYNLPSDLPKLITESYSFEEVSGLNYIRYIQLKSEVLSDFSFPKCNYIASNELFFMKLYRQTPEAFTFYINRINALSEIFDNHESLANEDDEFLFKLTTMLHLQELTSSLNSLSLIEQSSEFRVLFKKIITFHFEILVILSNVVSSRFYISYEGNSQAVNRTEKVTQHFKDFSDQAIRKLCLIVMKALISELQLKIRDSRVISNLKEEEVLFNLEHLKEDMNALSKCLEQCYNNNLLILRTLEDEDERENDELITSASISHVIYNFYVRLFHTVKCLNIRNEQWFLDLTKAKQIDNLTKEQSSKDAGDLDQSQKETKAIKDKAVDGGDAKENENKSNSNKENYKNKIEEQEDESTRIILEKAIRLVIGYSSNRTRGDFYFEILEKPIFDFLTRLKTSITTNTDSDQKRKQTLLEELEFNNTQFYEDSHVKKLRILLPTIPFIVDIISQFNSLSEPSHELYVSSLLCILKEAETHIISISSKEILKENSKLMKYDFIQTYEKAITSMMLVVKNAFVFHVSSSIGLQQFSRSFEFLCLLFKKWALLSETYDKHHILTHVLFNDQILLASFCFGFHYINNNDGLSFLDGDVLSILAKYCGSYFYLIDLFAQQAFDYEKVLLMKLKALVYLDKSGTRLIQNKSIKYIEQFWNKELIKISFDVFSIPPWQAVPKTQKSKKKHTEKQIIFQSPGIFISIYQLIIVEELSKVDVGVDSEGKPVSIQNLSYLSSRISKNSLLILEISIESLVNDLKRYIRMAMEPKKLEKRYENLKHNIIAQIECIGMVVKRYNELSVFLMSYELKDSKFEIPEEYSDFIPPWKPKTSFLEFIVTQACYFFPFFASFILSSMVERSETPIFIGGKQNTLDLFLLSAYNEIKIFEAIEHSLAQTLLAPSKFLKTMYSIVTWGSLSQISIHLLRLPSEPNTRTNKLQIIASLIKLCLRGLKVYCSNVQGQNPLYEETRVIYVFMSRLVNTEMALRAQKRVLANEEPDEDVLSSIVKLHWTCSIFKEYSYIDSQVIETDHVCPVCTPDSKEIAHVQGISPTSNIIDSQTFLGKFLLITLLT